MQEPLGRFTSTYIHIPFCYTYLLHTSCMPQFLSGKLFELVIEVTIASLIGYQSSRVVCYIKRNDDYDDPFTNFCQKSEGEIVFITLKSNKIYTGILVSYPEEASPHLQHVVVLPITSGYRDKEGQAVWKTTYPENQSDESESIKLAISKEEITTITPWKKEAEFSETY